MEALRLYSKLSKGKHHRLWIGIVKKAARLCSQVDRRVSIGVATRSPRLSNEILRRDYREGFTCDMDSGVDECRIFICLEYYYCARKYHHHPKLWCCAKALLSGKSKR